MLGHIKPPLCRLSTEAKNEYKSLYCSICYSVRQQFGVMNALFISNELALLSLAFSNNFTAQTVSVHCPARLFFTKKTVLKHDIIDFAAQFSLILAWIKITDWETDNPAFYKSPLKNVLDKKVQRLLPTLSYDTRQVIDKYIQLTKNSTTNFSEVRKMSALLARQGVEDMAKRGDKQDDFLNILLKIAESLGEMIAIADPLLDLEKDIKNQAFNPIVASSLENNTTIQEEYAQCKQHYHAVENRVNHHIQSLTNSSINKVFGETLYESVFRLTRIVEKAAFSILNTDNNQQDKKNKKENAVCRYCDCCDCINCFNGCDCGKCGACENCECCGGCDCSC